MLQKILYTSLVDVSVPNGPGVNERVFLHDMLGRFGNDLLAVIPEPTRGLPSELGALRLETIPTRSSSRSMVGWALGRLLGTPVLLHALRRFSPDLIVMRTGSIALPHHVITRVSDVPYVIKTAGDVSFRGFYENRRFARLVAWANDWMFGEILNGAACIDVVSAAQRDRAIQFFPHLRDRIHIVDNGVDVCQFRPNLDSQRRREFGFCPRDFVIGYVGNYPMQRGGKEVVDIVVAMRDRGVRGLIVGDTGEADTCREYASASGVSTEVVVYGEAEFSDVPSLMNAMDIGISVLRPEERGASEQKVRQYLAVGLCVIGVAGSNDFLDGRPFARVIETHDAGEVIEAAADLVCLGRPRLEALGREARQFAKANLSFTARNDDRLELWRRSVHDWD